MKTAGRGRPDAVRWSNNSKPDIPGSRISRIRQAWDSGTALPRNSSAEAKVCASNPDAHSNRPKARLKLASSSTIPMVHLLAGVFWWCTTPYYRKSAGHSLLYLWAISEAGEAERPTHFEPRAFSRRSISAARMRPGRSRRATRPHAPIRPVIALPFCALLGRDAL